MEDYSDHSDAQLFNMLDGLATTCGIKALHLQSDGSLSPEISSVRMRADRPASIEKLQSIIHGLSVELVQRLERQTITDTTLESLLFPDAHCVLNRAGSNTVHVLDQGRVLETDIKNWQAEYSRYTEFVSLPAESLSWIDESRTDGELSESILRGMALVYQSGIPYLRMQCHQGTTEGQELELLPLKPKSSGISTLDKAVELIEDIFARTLGSEGKAQYTGECRIDLVTQSIVVWGTSYDSVPTEEIGEEGLTGYLAKNGGGIESVGFDMATRSASVFREPGKVLMAMQLPELLTDSSG